MASFRQTDIKRALEAAMNMGLSVGGCRIASDGPIKVQIVPPRQYGRDPQLLNAEEKVYG